MKTSRSARSTARDGSASSADEIKAFAAKFDPQPFHLDERAAAGTFFGGLAASGWHTAALTMRLLVTGDLKPAGGIVGLGGDLGCAWPLRPGDELRVESTSTIASPSRWPKASPMLVRMIVIVLSIMICEGFRKPFASSG